MDDLDAVLAFYRDDPLDNGDAVAFLDGKVVLEMEGVADQWDPVIRDNLCSALEDVEVRDVALAVCRPEAVPLPQDHAMWADLRESCFALGIKVQPLLGLPAAERRRASA